MSVHRRYYASVLSGVVNSFLIDINNAHLQADHAGDREGQDALLHLWLEHFDHFLGNMPSVKLVEYLETRRVWRHHEEWRVIKTVDEPCIVYTAQRQENEVTLIALGACYRYPNSNEAGWWERVILPRVGTLK